VKQEARVGSTLADGTELTPSFLLDEQYIYYCKRYLLALRLLGTAINALRSIERSMRWVECHWLMERSYFC
jgi:hypothetical protein